MNNLKLEDLEILFDALKPNSNKSITDALEKTIKLSKQKGINYEEFKNQLDSFGIKRTEKLNDWLLKNF
jgi:hypothetical protein